MKTYSHSKDLEDGAGGWREGGREREGTHDARMHRKKKMWHILCSFPKLMGNRDH